MAGGGRRGLVPTVRSSEGAGKGIQRGSERAERVTTLFVVVCSVRQWLSDGESWRDKAGGSRGGTAEPISQAAHLGIGCGPVSGDVEYPQDSSERRTSANSGKIPDANARPTKPLSIERGPNKWAGATDEQRAKNTESTGASPQESGGQVTLRNRWQSGVREKTMKITCPSNEHCYMCGLSFLHGCDHGACVGSVVGMPKSAVCAQFTVTDLPFPPCMRLCGHSNGISSFQRICFFLSDGPCPSILRLMLSSYFCFSSQQRLCFFRVS